MAVVANLFDQTDRRAGLIAETDQGVGGGVGEVAVPESWLH